MKINRQQVREIREQAQRQERFWGRNELAKKYGVTTKRIQQIVRDIRRSPELLSRQSA